MCAVLFALLGPLVQAMGEEQVAWGELTVIVLLGTGAAVVIGFCVGMFHHRQPMGFLLGSLIGLLLGPLISSVTLIPVNMTWVLFLVAIGGSVMLLGLGVVLRCTSGNSAEPLEATVIEPSAVEATLVDSHQDHPNTA